MGERGYGPTKNICVRNNLMEFGHGGVVIGSEVGGGIRDVTISKCIFIGTDRGLRVKSRRGRGERSVIDNIRMENVLMEGVWTPFVINMFYHCGPDGHDDYVQNKNPLPVDKRTPTVGTIYVENVVCRNAMTAAGFMYGLPERKIRHVSMKNVEINMDKEGKVGLPAMMDGIDEVKQAGFTLVNIEKIELQNVRIKGQQGESIIMTGVEKLIREE
jgi:polygalacturonase